MKCVTRSAYLVDLISTVVELGVVFLLISQPIRQQASNVRMRNLMESLLLMFCVELDMIKSIAKHMPGFLFEW
jgi:hypothetical protein